MNKSVRTLWDSSSTKTVLASLLSILIGLTVGSLVVVIVGLTKSTIPPSGIWDGVRLVFAGIFSTGRNAAGILTWGYNAQNLGNMLFRATPLVMTGLSVAVAYKTGLFNIGAPGQYLMGTLATLVIALGIPSSSVPAGFIWILAFLGGILAGALWGAIPGALKAFLNINEVLASIMTNWLAANIVTWAFDVSNFKNVVENTKSGYIYKTTFNGVATPKLLMDKLFPGSQANGGFLIAIVFAIGVGLAFSTGTSWGTFGVLLPIVCAVFPSGELMVISVSACLAGAVCGDHCSPISDTTIMASAGAECNHIGHVSTQLPYALTVAGVSFVGYLLAGFVQNVWIVLPVSMVMMLATLFIIQSVQKKAG